MIVFCAGFWQVGELARHVAPRGGLHGEHAAREQLVRADVCAKADLHGSTPVLAECNVLTSWGCGTRVVRIDDTSMCPEAYAAE
jgi:hypothetical protein